MLLTKTLDDCVTDSQGAAEELCWRNDLDERGARRIAHLIEATYVAYGDARTRVKHMKTRDPGD